MILFHLIFLNKKKFLNTIFLQKFTNCYLFIKDRFSSLIFFIHNYFIKYDKKMEVFLIGEKNT